MVECPDCKQVFSERYNMLKHLRNQHVNLVCEQCERIFFGNSSYQKHVKVHSKTKEFKCSQCDKVFGKSYNLKRHEKLCKNEGSGIGTKRPANPIYDGELGGDNINGFNITNLRSAFGGAGQTWRIKFDGSTDDVISQLKEGILTMEGTLSTFRYQRIIIKIYYGYSCRL